MDFELKIPFRDLSWTQVNTYLNDPKDYYEKYLLGKDFMETLEKENPKLWEKIILGGIFQEAWYDPRINWKKKLKKYDFTSNKQRIIETALKDSKIIKMAPSKCENKYRMVYEGIPIQIKPDGFDKDKKILIENKFGSPRSQEMVDEDNQLSFYTLGIKILFGFIPKKIYLQSVNDKTGKVNVIETTRTQEDLDHIGGLIIEAARGISAGVWEKC